MSSSIVPPNTATQMSSCINLYLLSPLTVRWFFFFFFFKTRCVNRGKNKYNQHVSLWSIQSWTPGALKKRALCVLHTQLNKHSDKHKNSAILGVWCGKKSTEKPDPVWPPFHLMGIVEPPGESSSSTYIKCVLLICLDNFFFFF